MPKALMLVCLISCLKYQELLMSSAFKHYNDVIMGAMSSQTPASWLFAQSFFLGADQRKHQSSASLAFVRGIHRCPVNSPHKGPVTRKMFPFDDVIMCHTLIIVNDMRVTCTRAKCRWLIYFSQFQAISFDTLNAKKHCSSANEG